MKYKVHKLFGDERGWFRIELRPAAKRDAENKVNGSWRKQKQEIYVLVCRGAPQYVAMTGERIHIHVLKANQDQKSKETTSQTSLASTLPDL